LITLPAATAIAGLAALVVGALSLRTRGFFFLMVTLAFGQMMFFLFHDTKLGGGTDGAFLSRPVLALLGWELPLTRRQRPIATYYISLGLLVAAYLALVLILRSLFGRVLEGIRVNEHRMLALGYPTYRYKLAAFVIAGMLAGVAGHMWTMHRGFVNPELIGWHHSAEALLMILLGGLTTLHGPIIGALVFTGLGEFSQLVTERKLLVEGLVVLFAVLALPKGLSGIVWPRRQGGTGDTPPTATVGVRPHL
jgi:branched-chain amino acid transport system permease protein